MNVVELAFFGIGFFGAFIVVHLLYGRFQQDPTNTEFWKSIVVAFVAGLLFRYGLPVAEPLLSLKGLILIMCSVLVAWKLAGVLSELFWWEGLIIGGTASITFLVLYLGSAWAWGRILGFQ